MAADEYPSSAPDVRKERMRTGMRTAEAGPLVPHTMIVWVLRIGIGAVLLVGNHGFWYVGTHRPAVWTDLAPTSARGDADEHLVRFILG